MVETGEPVVGRVVVVGVFRQTRRAGRRVTGQRVTYWVTLCPVAAEHADGGPRRDGEGDGQREKHRGGGADGDGPHVRAHEPADEGHGQNGGDHGPSGEDSGVADLDDGFEGDLVEGLGCASGQAQVADDVFNDDDGVVHEDADREDQGEERDAVERVSIKVEHEQGERERRGDGEEHDERFAPAEKQKDEDCHAEDGDAHVEEKLVAFLGGGVTVVAGDGEVDVGGQQRAAQGVGFGEDLFDDGDGVGTGALGDADGDGGLGVAGARTVQHVVGRLGCGVSDRGDVTQVNRFSAEDAEHDRTDVVGVVEELAGFEKDFPVGKRTRAGGKLAVGCLERRGDLGDGEVARREGGGIEFDAQSAAGSADERGLGDERDGFDGVLDLRGEAAEREVVERAAVQGKREDGDVVDGARLDQGSADAGRDAVEVGLEFLVEADEGGLDVGADFEAHDHHRLAGRGRAVEVFDAGDFPEKFFHRTGHAVLDLLGRGARHGDEHVDHGDFDLRFLLARELENGEGAKQHRGDHGDNREFGRDRGRRDATGETGTLRGCAHGRTSTGWPSRNAAGGSITTCSPASRPEATRTRPAVTPEVLTIRSTAQPSVTTKTRSI